MAKNRKCKTGFTLSTRRVMSEGRIVLVCATCGVESKDHA